MLSIHYPNPGLWALFVAQAIKLMELYELKRKLKDGEQGSLHKLSQKMTVDTVAMSVFNRL